MSERFTPMLRTKVSGSRTIRYRPSSNHKQCQLARDQRALLDDLFGTLWETKAFRLPPVEVWLQS